MDHAVSHAIVSDEQEQLILVDSDDREIGAASKSECHDDAGILHRALSVFVFDARGRLLLQRRHPSKRLWGGHWSNSCCSHPRVGEDIDSAARRRVKEELGLDITLRPTFKFEYSATFDDKGTEHELCHVFIGFTDADPVVNATEISDWRWVAPAEVDRGIEQNAFTPWMQHEWPRLRREHADALHPERT